MAATSNTDGVRLKKRGIALAGAGYILALAIALGLKLLGLADMAYREWASAAAFTLGLQTILWLIPHLELDRHIRWDRHYLYTPMLAAALNFCIYTNLIFEARWIILMGWFVALLFVAGLAGFWEVIALSIIVAVGYFGVVCLHYARGAVVSLGIEAATAGAFVLVSLYAGVLFERIRRYRTEMKALRRRLAELALTDPLTELPNRRRFEEILRAELGRVARYGGECALVMIDVDYFKNYNDALGHLAGDVILKELTQLMREQLRMSDVLARYGGEEFGLIMMNTPKEEAYQAVERLRRIIEEHPFRGTNVLPGRRLTISAGVASAPHDARTYEDLVQKADSALYAAKRTGRNLVLQAASGY